VAESMVVANDEVDLSRRKFLTSATIGVGAVGAVLAAVPFVASWEPSERARALGVPTELDLSKVDPGQMVIILWRKQPIYVVRRTPEMVSSLTGHDDRLKDPESIGSVGVYISAVVVLILLYSGWKGGDLVFKHGVGVRDRSNL